MSKLAKNTLPTGHTREDFRCFGPVAEKDGEFSGTMMCDMGCFKQGEVDSNKFYHAAVVQSTKNNNWYAYFEYGRTGSTTKPQFQLIEGPDKSSAQHEYEKQLHSKNDRRGEWVDKGALGKVLQAKPGKDCYLVRPLSARNTGLPDAKNISNAKVIVSANTNFDSESKKLIQDLNVGATEYARSSIVGEAIPTMDAIDKVRLILDEATKINNTIQQKLPKTLLGQIPSKYLEQLIDLTSMAYSLIQKHKKRKCAEEEWILNPTNIQVWRDDLDVYENVVNGQSYSTISSLPFNLRYISKNDRLYLFLSKFMEKATKNRHSYLGRLKINHIWETGRDEHYKGFKRKQKEIIRQGHKTPLHQTERKDIKDDLQDFINSGTWMLFHGTRSVNVGSIMSSGLRLPKELSNVAINGAMFGGGIYTADDWKKSAGYCSLSNSYWARGDGSIKGRGAFMFICDVILGNPYMVTSSRAFTNPPKGYDSIFAEAGYSVQNNEFIVFDKHQVNLRYLVEFENV